MKQRILMLIISLLSTNAIAAVETTPIILPPNEISVPVHHDRTYKYYAYIDGSYNNLNRDEFISGAPARSNDLVENGFALQQADISFAIQPHEGWGGLINIFAGTDAQLSAPYGWNPTTEFDSQTFAVFTPEAFVQYKRGPFIIYGPQFYSLIGYEFVDPTLDNNFSRGILAYAQPNSVTGVRGIYLINDNMLLAGGINNGWDNIRDWSRRKTVEYEFCSYDKS